MPFWLKPPPAVILLPPPEQGVRGRWGGRAGRPAMALEHGIATNWDDMEECWHHTFYYELRVAT